MTTMKTVTDTPAVRTMTDTEKPDLDEAKPRAFLSRADLYAVKATHLLLLMQTRWPRNAELQSWNEQLDEADDATNYHMLILVAGIALVRKARRGVSWEELKEAFETRRGRPEVFRILSRAVRAMRLLDRALTAGCLKRGEA